MLAVVIFDLILGFSALIYDWHTIITLPIWLLPVIIICPLYPFLLALTWWRIHLLRPSIWLQAFATVPSAMYGILALVFYPLVMQVIGFSWTNLLAIIWVWLYASQSWYLLNKYPPINQFPILVVSICALSVFFFQLQTNSYSYLAFDVLSTQSKTVLLTLAVLTIVGINVALLLLSLGTVDRRTRR